ncbi:unsaturated chondroitin disaccharide hydrolase [Paenibacillus phyllosphaerae]|uniref:Unsaturated chondroitin disaccharide hydrolase n=1 Tax=Paenibacillus phyllosphaerae TaxID=274593 RepID=A0A7W5AWQ4_9BACL|nr:glycoside hydrolase family 88 protein [Paenibacillus phyllosphaerae]MBB3110209.1 unsaturated chondroitin disaccharide hydrolase [Paenibacillus phyllosphaerae]
MWQNAIEDAVAKTRNNIKRFGDLFPHVSQQGIYELNPNTDWTNGFWSGLLWLCYEYTGEPQFKEAADRTVAGMRRRMDVKEVLAHHDIGFLYSLSAKAAWILTGDEGTRELTIQAADKLMERWREQGQYLQAWGPVGDEQEGGRIIIDCLMNLPLLYWAAELTGDERYRHAAIQQADKSRRYLVRGDDSSYHTFFFNQETGEPIGGATHQGFTNGSTWTRGQAWGIYGFALSYRYTRDPLYLDTSKRLARFFIDHLPEDLVAYWDFNAPQQPGTPRDSSASAIAAAGLLELLLHLPADDSDRHELEQAVIRSLASLVERYSTMDDPDAEGLLNHGSYHVRGNLSLDDYMIWGDYFYLEALLRLERGIPGYWYERAAGDHE